MFLKIESTDENVKCCESLNAMSIVSLLPNPQQATVSREASKSILYGET